MRRALTALLLALLVPAGSAAAATTVADGGCATGTCMSITADAADIDVTQDAGVAVTVTAVSGTLTAGGGCTGGATVVTCPVVTAITVLGSGADDVVDAAGVRVPVTFQATGGDDDFAGGAGDDVFTLYFMGDGADRFRGGPGRDRISYQVSVAPLTISLDDQANDGAAGEGDDVGSDVEVVEGGESDDTIIGPAAAVAPLPGGEPAVELHGFAGVDQLQGGPGAELLAGDTGDDTLAGGGGADVLDGEPGSDTLDGEAGDDVLRAGDDIPPPPAPVPPSDDVIAGGAGRDTVVYDGVGPPAATPLDVSVTIGAGADDGHAGEGDDVQADVEDVTTGGGDDTITGTARGNDVDSGDGADDVDPGLGPDRVDAGPGADVLHVRDGHSDRVACAAGADTVTGDEMDELDACEQADLVPAVTTIRETVTVPGPVQVVPGPVQVVQAPPARSGAPADATPPRLTLTGLAARLDRKALLSRGVRLTVAADEPVRVTARLLGRARGARLASAGDLVLGQAVTRSRAARAAFTLRVTRSLRASVRRARTVVVEVVATDAAGNDTTVRRTLRLR